MKIEKVLTAVFLSAVFFSCPLLAQPGLATDPVNHYAVQRATAPMAIDGHLHEFAWEAAAQIDGCERILNDYDPIARPTRAKMLWDDDNFYFAFVCRDPDAWAIFDQEDDPMWSEEVVEVFIDPDGDERNYLELEVNPLNAIVDLHILALEPEWHASKDWDIKGLQTAVQVYGSVNDSLAQDLGWTVEIAIPWTAFADSISGGGRPSPGARWRLNLYRIERMAGRDLKQQINALEERARPWRRQLADLRQEIGAESLEQSDPENWRRQLSADQQHRLEQIEAQLASLREARGPLDKRHHESTEYTAWSETYQRGFHHPARFGVVHFVD